MKKIIELLTQAELEAKKVADENPGSPTAQILRARVRSALEITEHVKLDKAEVGGQKSEAGKN